MNEPLRSRILYLKDVERLSFRQIEETTGIPRRRAAALYAGSTPCGDRMPKTFLILEPYRQLITEWYQQFPRLSAAQVFERLKARDIAVGYTSVKRFTRQFRRKKSRCYFELYFSPGEEAQVDWFVVDHAVLGKLAGFAFVLSYSRFLYATLFPRMTFEFFIEGHLNAFELLAGLPRGLRYDNLKSVVLSRTPLTYNSSFLAFAHYHSFEIKLCNVARGNEKGRVERGIRTIREGFLSTADHIQTLPALNASLAEWCAAYNSKPHRTTGKPPAVLRLEEPLKTLPHNRWLNRVVHAPTTPSKTGLITFDTNRYSIPEHLVNHPLSVHSFCERIEIHDADGKRVAAHPRSFLRNQTFLNPLHRTFSQVSERAKRERIVAVISRCDPAFERFLLLTEAQGETRESAAYALFQLLRAHSRAVLLSAVRDELSRGSASVARVRELLAGTFRDATEEVRPMNSTVLTLTFTPRSLEEYS